MRDIWTKTMAWLTNFLDWLLIIAMTLLVLDVVWGVHSLCDG